MNIDSGSIRIDELRVDADRVRVVPGDRDDLALLLAAVLEREQRRRPRRTNESAIASVPITAVDAPRQQLAASGAIEDRAREREASRTSQRGGREAHPCSSRSSSTSIGRRRR